MNGLPSLASDDLTGTRLVGLAMIWLAGEKIPGQDPTDEEYSEKQMNFGFSLGDELSRR